MTSWLTPLLLFGIGDSILGFLDALMTPLYAAVSGILAGAYRLLSPVFGEGSGLSWTLGIVGLTVAIRTLLIPLFVKQINSARNMQLIQPKVKLLQDKYGADRERLGQEMMKLYQSEGVNPMASCFPLLLQMPIFIALFNVLNAAARGTPKGYFFEQAPELATSMAQASLFGARLAGTAFPFVPFGATQVLALLLIAGMTGILFVTQLQLMSKNMPLFSSHSYAYRPDLGVYDAIRYINSEWRGNHRLFVAEYDFAHYFDSISHSYLFNLFKQLSVYATPLEVRICSKFTKAPEPYFDLAGKGAPGEPRAGRRL